MSYTPDNENAPTVFQLRYQTEEILDLDYVKSIGGWHFIKSITPMFLKSSKEAFGRIVFEEYDTKGMQLGLHKLITMANIVGALKLVRAGLVTQAALESKKSDLSLEIENIQMELDNVERLLTSGEQDVDQSLQAS